MSLAVKHYFLHFNVLTLIVLFLNLQLPAQNKNSTPTNFPEPKFEQLTIADGLPENSVRSILQDHLGYMWFGTQNGLVNYDGYNMVVYQPDTNDSLSISGRTPLTIYENKSGTLWVGTNGGGLNRFDRLTETFTSYIHNPDDSTSINSNVVGSICEDKNGDILVGTDKGLNLFNRQNKNFRHIYFQDSIYSIAVKAIIEDRLTGKFYVGRGNKIFIFDTVEKTLIYNSKINGVKSNLGIINSFYQAVDGTIWIGHSKGIARLNSMLNTIKYYQPTPSLEYKDENDITQLMGDESGFIWAAGPWNKNTGLICFNLKNEQFRSYKSVPDKRGSLSRNIVWSVYKDKSGILWVGTGWGGLNKWDRKKEKFKRFKHDPVKPDDERFKDIFALTQGPDRIIWFGTANGLHSFDCTSNDFRNYSYDTKDKNNTVNRIYADESGIIWFGTTTRGLGKFDRTNSSFHFYSNDTDDSTSISHNWISFIVPDENDILWIGTWGGGLNRFDKKTGRFTRYTHDPNNLNSLSQNYSNCLYLDQKGKLWIGNNWRGGLNLFNRTNESFKLFSLQKNQMDKQESVISNTTILTIYEDRKGTFWIGTYHSGLHLFDRERGISVSNITELDGLANNQVNSILEDDTGNLWIGTIKGLSRFNPETRNIRNYFTSDVFKENRYYINSICKTSTGQMLFGTSDGFIMFYPDSIKDDPVPPQVVISNVSLFNRPGEKLKFDGFISELDELDLSYDQNDLRFDYVGLHFGEPQKNQYKYMLENFDDDWIDAGFQRNATYTNLDAGEYVFRVTASNRDGVWNKVGASLNIIIPPPFWATWWAYSFYVLLFGSVLYGIRKYEMNRINWKNQFKLDEIKLKEREETDRMKSRFFANISHEFRTPLTLIIGPTEKVLSESDDDETHKQLSIVKRSANRLLGLINQLLDLSKLEAGKLELKASKADIVSFVKGITMSFESVAERKDITLKVKTSSDEIEIYFDREKMTKIMTNLLSNAFKFTPECGEIKVALSLIPSPPGRGMSEGQGEGEVRITVADSGVGISEDELSKLFDRFYQVDSSQTREHEGTGIGLALTKELVELHKGTISADSKLGDPDLVGTGWTEFTIELPLGRRHLKDEEIVDHQKTEQPEDVILIPDKVGEKNLVIESEDSIELETEDKTIILIVEDNADVREFIKDSLGDNFQIEEAVNGEQGVRKAEKIIPDLIISDVMMPKMDGNELTRILKNDEKTSHIPIILLTAKSEQQSKLEGLETGADDYLTKPFDTKELQIRINNLISIRRKLQEKFSSGDYLPVKRGDEKKLSNLEEQFMYKVGEVIENHISEEEFSIEQFGKEVGMSSVQIFRKLKALTGKSPSLYIRSIRLVRAKKMIEEKEGNISEIAYSVGFGSPSYFTRCFKEKYGYPPSDLTS